MMKTFSRSILYIAAASVLFVGCRTPKNVAYLSTIGEEMTSNLPVLAGCTIQSDDLLNITVSSETPESALPFNQETNRAINNGTSYSVVGGNTMAAGYLVDAQGRITFPAFGRIKVAGLTTAALADTLEQRLISAHYINDPEVTVRLMNYKVSVIGEVVRPTEVRVEGERITIFEAISRAGDLTINGQRENVMVIREENSKRTVAHVDLTDGKIFDSPYYYLHQNDVVYVEPNKMRKKMSRNSETKTLQIVSTFASLCSTVAMVFYYYKISTRF